MFKRILPILLLFSSLAFFFYVKSEVENQDLIETELNIEQNNKINSHNQLE